MLSKYSEDQYQVDGCNELRKGQSVQVVYVSKAIITELAMEYEPPCKDLSSPREPLLPGHNHASPL